MRKMTVRELSISSIFQHNIYELEGEFHLTLSWSLTVLIVWHWTKRLHHHSAHGSKVYEIESQDKDFVKV